MRPLRQILSLTSSVLLLVPGVFARPLPAQFDATDKYSIVLDLVFPEDWDQCRTPRSFFGTREMIIRILPGLSDESQVFICEVDPHQFFVISSTLEQKEGSVWGHTQVLRRIDYRSSVQEEKPGICRKNCGEHPPNTQILQDRLAGCGQMVSQTRQRSHELATWGRGKRRRLL